MNGSGQEGAFRVRKFRKENFMKKHYLLKIETKLGELQQIVECSENDLQNEIDRIFNLTKNTFLNVNVYEFKSYQSFFSIGTRLKAF